MPSVGARPRSPVLAQFIGSFHYHENDTVTALERILPGARVHIMVNLHEDQFRTYHGPACSDVRRTGGAILEGPHSQPVVIDTRLQRRLVTVDFKLAGARPFFKMPGSEAGDRLVDLDRLWGRAGATLRERLLDARTPQGMFAILESALLEHVMRPEPRDAAIRFAAFALQRGASVSEVTAQLGLLPRTFVRRFRRETGIAPKRFARVRRLQRLLESVHDPSTADWSELAAAHGYSDQSHLIHDFRDLTGLTPGSYRPRSPHEQNHVPIAPD